MSIYEVFGQLDTGEVREHNEDAFLINKIQVSEDLFLHQLLKGDFILAVADGVGGENSGEVAAEICLKSLATLNPPITQEILKDKILDINNEIIEYGQRNQESLGLCTTVAGMHCSNDIVTLFHVGDSRVYRYRDGFLKQLTIDDTLVQLLFSAGKITREELEDHPDKNILYQVLGIKNEEDDLALHIQELNGKFENDDIFLLCSDGLHDMVSHDSIEKIISKNISLQDIVQNLIKKANEQGGYDNVTVLAVKKYSHLE